MTVNPLGPFPTTLVDYKGDLQRLIQSWYPTTRIGQILDYRTVSTEDDNGEEFYICSIYLSLPGDLGTPVFKSAEAATSKEVDTASAFKCLEYLKGKMLSQPMQ